MQTLMRYSILNYILAVLSAICMLVSCGTYPSGMKHEKLDGQVSISGAFALYPLAVQWSNEFQVKYPGVKIDVSAGGAGKGMTDVLNGMVDYAMLSRDLHEEEKDAGAIAFVVGMDAVIPDVNAENPYIDIIQKRGITSDEARKIWVTGEIKTWGQLLGNNDRHKIHVYTRSDACGAAQTFALWFDSKQEDLIGTAVFGDPGIAQAVQKDKWGIGYNNLAYAYDPQTHRPQEGIAMFPVDSDMDGEINEEESCYATKEHLVHAIEDGIFPAPPARNLYFVSKGAPKDSASVAFLKYVIKDGQKFNEPAGYVRISGKVQSEDMKLLRSSRRAADLRNNNTDLVIIVFFAIMLGIVALLSGSVFHRTLNKKRIYKQRVSSVFMFILTISSVLLLVSMIVGLFWKSMPILQENSFWSLVTSSEWKPSQKKFGFLPFISGTLSVTFIAICIALPLSILTAISLTEYSKKVVRKFVYPALDILAALPSVIYGVWGILLLIPVTGYSLITAALVLCVMVLPIMVSLFVEIFSSVPQDLRDASMALGATQWQTTKNVVLRKSLSGIFAAVVLALSKAMGETIAVMMVCGSIPAIPKSLFKGFYTLPALIGNNYGEMASVPLYESAIMFAALLLLAIVIIFNVLSRIILYNVQKKSQS